MDDQLNAQTSGQRRIVESLDREFARLHFSACRIIENTREDQLYLQESARCPSVGDRILRAAAAIERTFGGLTANLWDDPFEWTLPEYLSTPSRIIEHLGEVEALRAKAFESFTDDSCLLKHVATPADETVPLIELLLETLVNAARLHGDSSRNQAS